MTSFSRAEPYPESRGGLAERPALSLPRHPDQHHPHVLVILGVDQELRERARLRVDPVLADPASPIVVGKQQHAEELGSGGRAQGHDWHVNGDGTVCLFQSASDWTGRDTAAELVVGIWGGALHRPHAEKKSPTLLIRRNLLLGRGRTRRVLDGSRVPIDRA
jgi:hypothetical protein